MHQAIIPGLPDDLALRCLARLSHGYCGVMETVSKRWRDVMRSEEYSNFKAREGWCGDWLFVPSEKTQNQWIAYDPEADRWHPLPPRPHLRWDGMAGFCCVCVNRKFLVIGGTYKIRDPRHAHSYISDEVFQFDPFKKEWSTLASMRTSRSSFACCVMDGKIYVAGGVNPAYPRGLHLAEVYDPLTNKHSIISRKWMTSEVVMLVLRWEDLSPMGIPAAECMGIAYKSKFHVLSHSVGFLDQTRVFDPLSRNWEMKQKNWPFMRIRQVEVQVTDDNQVCAVNEWLGSIVKTRDAEREEWFNVGKVPSVFVPQSSQPREVCAYGFAALGHELYVVGGDVLTWAESREVMLVLPLDRAWVCNPTCLPLSWRETRPMCLNVSGHILGCASLKESA